MRNAFLIGSTLLGLLSSSALAANVAVSAAMDNGVSAANGMELAIGNWVRVGRFKNLSDAAIASASVQELAANWVSFGDTTVGANFGFPGHWDANLSRSPLPADLVGGQIQIWILRATNNSTVTQAVNTAVEHSVMYLDKAASAQWQYIANPVPLGNYVDISDLTNVAGTALVPSAHLVVGSFPNGTSSETFAPNFGLAATQTDTVTLPPTLTAPATNAANGSTVSFYLPETAQAGSLMLAFNNGAMTRTLVLASSQATQGAHAFTFSPANPTASPAIASGPAIPDGIYTVTLSYRDVLGHTPVSAASSNVAIDGNPPVFSLPAPIIVEATSAAGAVVTYTASASDAGSGVASSSFTPVSGSRFPRGTTTVNATATDNVGNMAAGSFTITVRDTTAPEVSGTFAPIDYLLGTPTPNFVPQAFATDAVGVVSVTQIPEAGTIDTEPGHHTVEITARDAAGNEGYAYVDLNIRAPFTTIVAKGGVVPGAGIFGSGVPADAVWQSFGVPTYVGAENSKFGFLGKFRTGGKTVSGVFVPHTVLGVVLVAKTGGPVPDEAGVSLEGVTFRSLKEPKILGDTAVLATIQGTGVTSANDSGLWIVGEVGGRLIAREGSVAPGTGGAVFKAITAFGGGVGLFYTATLRQNGTTVTSANDSGIWGETGLLWRQGSPLIIDGISTTVRSVKTLYAVSGSTGQGRAPYALVTYPNGATESVYFNYEDGAVRTAASIQPVTSETQIVKAGILSVIEDGFANPSSAFLATLATTIGTTTSKTLAVLDGDENIIAAQSGPTGIAGAVFKSFKDPVAGRPVTAFSATITGLGITSANDSGIWQHKAFGGGLSLVAREGSAAPGGGTFKSFTSLACLSHYGPVFTAKLTGTTVTSANDVGLWVASPAGLRKLLREGDTVNERTVRTFTILTAVVGSGAETRAFPPDGTTQMVAKITYTDGSEAIVQIEAP